MDGSVLTLRSLLAVSLTFRQLILANLALDKIFHSRPVYPFSPCLCGPDFTSFFKKIGILAIYVCVSFGVENFKLKTQRGRGGV